MGTSKGYQAPTSPQWRQLKAEITRASSSGNVSDAQGRQILGNFIRTNGGSHGMSSGGGGADAGSTGSGRAARRAGSNLARFAGAVASQGLAKALDDMGLGHLVGKSAGEIVHTLVNELCDDGSTLEEVDARKAMSDLNSKLLENTTTYEEVVQALEQQMRPESLGPLLFQFFGYYLYHRFRRVFFERLVRKHGEETAATFLGSIQNLITSLLKAKTLGRDLMRVAWAGQEGQTMAQEIFQVTLEVFEQ